jgi:hypothetical protein
MPRAGGVYSAPPGTKGTPNTTIESAKYNAYVDDAVADANAARLVTAGGTGSNTAVGGNDNLSTASADLASAATVNLANATGTLVNITGTVTITGLGTVGAGAVRDLVFAGSLTLTHDDTKLILPGKANIITAAGDVARMRSLGGGNWQCVSYLRAAVPPYSSTATETLKNKSLEDNTTLIVDDADNTKKLKFQVAGITTATTRTVAVPDADGTMLLDTRQQMVPAYRNLKVSISTASQAVITADALTVEDTNGNSVRLRNVNVTADISVAGANGLDTGSEAASAWYYGWVAWNGTTAIGLISASTTAPTLPAGYTHRTLVTAMRNDASSNFWRMLQYGRRAQILIGTNPTIPPAMASGSQGNTDTPTYVAVSVANFVPPIATVGWFGSYKGNNVRTVLAPNASYGNAFSSTNPPYMSQDSTNEHADNRAASVSMVLESGNVYWASSGTGLLAVQGWELNI